MSSSPEWVSLSDVGLQLHLDYHQVRRLMLLGVFQGRRTPGGRFEILASSAQAYQREHRRQPAATAASHT